MILYERILNSMNSYWDKISEEGRIKIFENIHSFPKGKRMMLYHTIINHFGDFFKGTPKFYEDLPIVSYLKDAKHIHYEVVKNPFESDFEREYSILLSKIQINSVYNKSEILRRVLDDECYNSSSFLKIISKFNFLINEGNRTIKRNLPEIIPFVLYEMIPFKLHGVEIYNGFEINKNEPIESMYLSLLYMVYIETLKTIHNDAVEKSKFDILAYSIYSIYKNINSPSNTVSSNNLLLYSIGLLGSETMRDIVVNKIHKIEIDENEGDLFKYQTTLSSFPFVEEIFSKYKSDNIYQKGIYKYPIYPNSGIAKNVISFGSNFSDEKVKEIYPRINFVVDNDIIHRFIPEKNISYKIDENKLGNIKYNFSDDIDFTFLKSKNNQDILLVHYLGEIFIAFTVEPDDGLLHGISVEEFENGSRHLLEIDCEDKDHIYAFVSNL